MTKFSHRRNRKHSLKEENHVSSKDPTPTHSNITPKRLYKHSSALTRNYLPATDIERGWVIDSGTSARMTAYERDCKGIQQTYRNIFLAGGSSLYCNQMGNINIHIKKRNHVIRILRLEDVLILPTLARSLFLVKSFLLTGNDRLLFQDDYTELGIRGGPKIRFPITSLQSFAMIVKSLSTHDNHDKVQNNEKQR